MTIGSQAVAHKATIVQSIIRDNSQVDVQFAVLPNMPPHSVLVQSNPRPRMPSGMSLLAIGKTLNGKTINGRLRSIRRPKVRKVREKALSQGQVQREDYTKVYHSKADTVFTEKE